MAWREGLKGYLLPHVQAALSKLDRRKTGALCEIRMHAGREVELSFPWGTETMEAAVSAAQMQDQLALLTGCALYRFERQMAQGYIPLDSGFRAGICGRMTREADGTWRMAQVNSICLRISRRVPGAAEAVYPYLSGTGGRPYSVLFFGQPGCGKTTVLRDAAEYMAETRRLRVAAADEREELFPLGQRVPARRIDVLGGCDKSKGLMMLLRTMAPQVIVCDEIGGDQEAEAIEEAVRCGVAVLATAHADSLKALRRRPSLGRLISSCVFDRYVLLGSMGTAEAIWDADGDLIWEEKGHGQLGYCCDGDDCGQRSGFPAL